jgi:hypothetical protein
MNAKTATYHGAPRSMTPAERRAFRAAKRAAKPTWYTCSLCGQDVLGQNDEVLCFDNKPGHDTNPALRYDAD